MNAIRDPNNDESGVAKFLAEVPIVEEEPIPEPIVGEIPQGNIINMVMGKELMRPETYHRLIGWCCKVLGFGDHDVQSSLPASDWAEHGGFSSEFIAKLDIQVWQINDISLLLKLIEIAAAGKRGCNRDKYNDGLAEAIKNACMNRLADFMDSLPPSLWHKVHRHYLWQQGTETEMVNLPSPVGWIAFSGVRPAQHGGWMVKMQIDNQSHESPQYVTGMGLKARHDGYAKGSHSGVTCQAFHLFNHDGSLWGFEVYLISPLKTVGCEVTKDGRFSLFRKAIYLPPRGDIRQGDMILRKLEYDGTPTEHRHEGYDYWHPITRVHTEETVSPGVVKSTTVKEWKAEPIESLPAELRSVRIHPLQNGVEYVDKNEDAVVVTLSYQGYINVETTEPVLVITKPTVLRHPDHPSIQLEAGYYQILPVEGETDYQPRQRRGD